MEEKEIYNTLNTIFREILDDDTISLTENTTADDIEDWDSLSHVSIVVSIEKKFGVKFTSLEIISWKNIGDMVKSITQRTN